MPDVCKYELGRRHYFLT